MSFVVVDTETTGLAPRNVLPTTSNFHRWNGCRIVQLAWLVYAYNGDSIVRKCYTIAPDGFTIENSRIHGITDTDARRDGRPIAEVLTEFLDDLQANEVRTFVAHNVAFDFNVVCAEMIRADMDIAHLRSLDSHCTMIHGAQPRGRWPKLLDLYCSTVGPTELVLHRADNDALLCAEIYIAQTKRRGKTKISCPCGSVHTMEGDYAHKRTIKHRAWSKKQRDA